MLQLFKSGFANVWRFQLLLLQLTQQRDGCGINAILHQASVYRYWCDLNCCPLPNGVREAHSLFISLSQILTFPNLLPFPKCAAEVSACLGTKHDQNIKDLRIELLRFNWYKKTEDRIVFACHF